MNAVSPVSADNNNHWIVTTVSTVGKYGRKKVGIRPNLKFRKIEKKEETAMPYFLGGIITSLIVCVIFEAVSEQTRNQSTIPLPSAS